MLTLLNTLPVIDRVFDDVMRNTFTAFASPQGLDTGVDIRTSDNTLSIELDLPGVKPEGLSAEMEGNVLRIRATRNPANGDSHGRKGTYSWAYKVPNGYDTEAMTAVLADGVLSIQIPLHPKAAPRKIPVLTGHEAKQLGAPEPTKTP